MERTMRRLLPILILSAVHLWAGVVLDAAMKPKVVVDDNAVPIVKYAAAELSEFIGRSLGVKVEQMAKADDGVRIYVGVGPDGRRIEEETYDSHIVIRGNTIYIYGYDTGEVDLKNL